MESTFNDILEELLLHIFCLQPMHSLLLSRSVCKLWNQIISTNYFIQLHLARVRSSNTNKYLLLEDASKLTSLVESENNVHNGIFGRKKYECYGICDGLLCLSSTKDSLHLPSSKIVLWNPIFKKVLPPLKIENSVYHYLCFGYHDNDYKVIKVVLFPHNYSVCIYSLSTDSWKVLEFDGNISGDYYKNGYRSSCRQNSKARFVNGAVYIIKDSWRLDHIIIYFDLSRKILLETELPGDFRWSGRDFIMEEYQESLALLAYDVRGDDEDDDDVVAMWVLRVSDSSFSWDYKTLLIKAESNYQFMPMGFINKDELLIRSAFSHAKPKNYFFLYNVKNDYRRQFASLKTRQSGISVGVDDATQPIPSVPTRQPTMNKVRWLRHLTAMLCFSR